MIEQQIEGKRYRLMREFAGLSREGLADILGLGREAIYRRECGRVRITNEQWMALETIGMRKVMIRSDQMKSMPSWKVLQKST